MNAEISDEIWELGDCQVALKYARLIYIVESGRVEYSATKCMTGTESDRQRQTRVPETNRLILNYFNGLGHSAFPYLSRLQQEIINSKFALGVGIEFSRNL